MEPNWFNTEITEEVLRFVLYGKRTEFPDNVTLSSPRDLRQGLTADVTGQQGDAYSSIAPDPTSGFPKDRVFPISPDLYMYPGYPEDLYFVPTFLPVPRQVIISLSSLPGCRLGVFATTGIRTGTEMGPFVGRVVGPQNINKLQHNCNYWEIYDNTGYMIYYIDGGTEDRPASWLTYVQCARTEEEQNLEIIQIGHEIYYKAIKDIGPDQELLVWYSTCSSLHMGLPFSILHDQPKVTNKNKEEILQIQQEGNTTASINAGKLKCVLCRRGFNSRSNLRSHMRIHTMEKPFPCKYCNRRFSQSSTLRNHIRLHTGEKPYKCQVCRSCYSQLAGLRAHQRSAKHKPNLHSKGS